jgi:hypothetical protein
VADEALHPDDVVMVDAANKNKGESEATVQTAALTPLVKGKTTLDKTKTVRFIDAPGQMGRASKRRRVATSRKVLMVSKARILEQTFTPSLGPFLDIGSNTPRHQQAFPSSRRLGANEQEGPPRLEEGKFPLVVSSGLQTVLMLLSVHIVRSSKAKVRPTDRLATPVPVFPLPG